MDIVDRIKKQMEEKMRTEVKAALEEMAAMGALVTSTDEATGETLYMYDDTDPRARMIWNAIANNEVMSIQ
ncbi:hypothetical protein HF563_17815 [Acidithiobacillus ferridurans]|nr:hypothetical protein [Acidithiobacillus ferridurans]